MNQNRVRSYGVREQAKTGLADDKVIETIERIGYAVIEGGYDERECGAFADAFDAALKASEEQHGGREELAALGEQNTIRALLATEPWFLSLAENSRVLAICRRLLGDYVVLCQQNGVISPPLAQMHTQGAFHRDLPYQHFVSSRPLAISAIFCIDPFTEENGATVVIPASHKSAPFPSDEVALDLQRSIAAPAGSFIVFDSMLYHRGGTNRTALPRRAVNQVYTIPLLRQQIDLPAMLGTGREFGAETRRLLGYDLQTPQNVAAYLAVRRDRRPS